MTNEQPHNVYEALDMKANGEMSRDEYFDYMKHHKLDDVNY